MFSPEQTESFMKEAIAEAIKSQAEDAGPHPKVGAILVDCAGTIIARSHRGEVMRESDGKKDAAHAEETILTEKIPKGNLSDATLFVTLEPCFPRGSHTSCAKHIIDRGVQQVYIGSLDPNPGICGKGEEYLRAHGITVERFPDRLIREIESLHREWVQAHRDKLLPPTSLYVTMQIADIMREQLLRKGLDIPELPADWDVTIEDVIRDVASQSSLRAVRTERHGNPTERAQAALPVYFVAKHVIFFHGHVTPSHTVPAILLRTVYSGVHVGQPS